MQITPSRLLPLVADIYRTAQDASAWSAVLEGLVSQIAGRSARILVMDSAGSTVHRSLKLNIEDSFHQPYVEHFVNLCPWRPELRQKPEGLLYSSALDFSCKQAEFLRSEFYNDWARPQQIEHGLCGTIYRDHSQIVQLLIQRTADPGHFTRDDQRWVNQLVPHIQQALQLGVLLARQGNEPALIQQLGQQHRGFMLLDEQGRLRYADLGAEAWLQTSSAVVLRQGCLQWRDVETQIRFQQGVKDCVATTQQRGLQYGARITLPASLFTLRLMPVFAELEHPLLQVTQTAVVAVIERAHTMVLTARESELIKALADGQSLRSFAASHGISYETARSRLKIVFSKTGVRRQHELVSWYLQWKAAVQL